MEPTVQTPAVAGQETDPSLVDVLEKNVRMLVRTSAVLVKLSERLDAIEKRLDEGDAPSDEAGPITEKRPLGALGRLALRQDGVVMLEITNDLAEADLADREVARFVCLTEAETSDAIDYADVGFSDAAARAGWQIARARKGYPVDVAPTEDV